MDITHINGKQRVKLTAPVGSYAALQAAIQTGADSVYFGIGHLNMRSGSIRNFQLDDLPQVISTAHRQQLEAYLALNTLIYDHEIADMYVLVEKAAQAGIDAIIAFDPAVITYAHKLKIPLHLSTQVNISNLESIKFYSQFADVMVLARELTLKQIRYIIDQIQKEKITGPSGALVTVEVFIHGALCMAIAGKCYLSLHRRNKSANRGECLQICRHRFTATDTETGRALEINNQYLMSPKDLCTIGFLNKIIDTGAGLLKIEGRARSPEYVHTVTRCYRQAIDAYYNGKYTQENIKRWQKQLRNVFNRGFWDGYYLGHKTGEWSQHYGSHATRRKIYVGPVANYYTNIDVGEFISQAESLQKGDDYLIIGPTTGVIAGQASELRIDDQTVGSVKQGERFTMPVKRKIRPADKLYKWATR